MGNVKAADELLLVSLSRSQLATLKEAMEIFKSELTNPQRIEHAKRVMFRLNSPECLRLHDLAPLVDNCVTDRVITVIKRLRVVA